MEFIVALLIVILVTVFPVMISARALKARNTGFWICLLAVICSSLVGGFVSELFSNQFISVVVAFVATAIIYSVVLGAGFVKSLLIALLSIVIQIGIVFIIGTLGLAAFSL